MKSNFRPQVFSALAVGLIWTSLIATRAAAADLESASVPYTATAIGDRINLRGQATVHSEVLGQLNRGDTVTVLESIVLEKPKPGDSTNWLRIRLPSTIPVWLHSSFVDTNLEVVSTRRLNMRGGPGENFSILGRLERSTPVKELRRQDTWIQIEAPTNAYGFVASEFFTRQETPTPPTEVKPPPTEVQPPTTVVVPPPPPDNHPPVVPPPPAPGPETVVTPVVVPPPPTPPEPSIVEVKPPEPLPDLVRQEAEAKERNLAMIRGHAVPPPPPADSGSATGQAPVPPRVVTREGIVRFTLNLNSPSWYELEAADSGKIINYLFTTDTNIAMKSFRGQKVLVTGEEALDRRWRSTPVIKIMSIRLAE